jgi:hypothetical protein
MTDQPLKFMLLDSLKAIYPHVQDKSKLEHAVKALEKPTVAIPEDDYYKVIKFIDLLSRVMPEINEPRFEPHIESLFKLGLTCQSGLERLIRRDKLAAAESRTKIPLSKRRK